MLNLHPVVLSANATAGSKENNTTSCTYLIFITTVILLKAS